MIVAVVKDKKILERFKKLGIEQKELWTIVCNKFPLLQGKVLFLDSNTGYIREFIISPKKEI